MVPLEMAVAQVDMLSDAAARTPLMLQTVLGLTAERIASSFLVSPDTMGRRLSRAKAAHQVTCDYQPFWALKAQLLQQMGTDRQATATAFQRAIGLTEDGAVRAYLIGKSAQQAG